MISVNVFGFDSFLNLLCCDENGPLVLRCIHLNHNHNHLDAYKFIVLSVALVINYINWVLSGRELILMGNELLSI